MGNSSSSPSHSVAGASHSWSAASHSLPSASGSGGASKVAIGEGGTTGADGAGGVKVDVGSMVGAPTLASCGSVSGWSGDGAVAGATFGFDTRTATNKMTAAAALSAMEM